MYIGDLGQLLGETKTAGTEGYAYTYRPPVQPPIHPNYYTYQQKFHQNIPPMIPSIKQQKIAEML
jgi:hypothetical protein